MVVPVSPEEVEPAARAEPALRGSVLDVVRTLLGDHQERDVVLSIVGKLVARTTELERRLARLATRFKPSEHVSKAQLVLFLEDLERFPDSAISDVHRRIGPEIPPRTIKRAFDLLVSEGTISATGERRWTRYRVANPIDQGGSDGR